MQATAESKERSTTHEREELAHAISHDLAQPLTTISGFARLLHSRYDIEFDEEAREQLHLIAERAGDLQQMIDVVVASLHAPAGPLSGAIQPVRQRLTV
jgi:light-regulated signal transduction histidine kinase (bacteriophytochrome)